MRKWFESTAGCDGKVSKGIFLALAALVFLTLAGCGGGGQTGDAGSTNGGAATISAPQDPAPPASTTVGTVTGVWSGGLNNPSLDVVNGFGDTVYLSLKQGAASGPVTGQFLFFGNSLSGAVNGVETSPGVYNLIFSPQGTPQYREFRIVAALSTDNTGAKYLATTLNGTIKQVPLKLTTTTVNTMYLSFGITGQGFPLQRSDIQVTFQTATGPETVLPTAVTVGEAKVATPGDVINGSVVTVTTANNGSATFTAYYDSSYTAGPGNPTVSASVSAPAPAL